ncbi:hypothetical protein ACETIH_03150 [Microvirga arabica]|uniref:Uncharacterized protein n=1 Tax=Microvirga arabica TaxID=1128671 RepID=A0ABV6Y3N0_9HYPH
MQASDPFPVEYLPRPVKETILAEFQGRHPTIHEVASVPDAHWLTLPAIGPTRLARLRSLMVGICDQLEPPALTRMTATQLQARYHRLQTKLKKTRDQLRATKAELWMRGIVLGTE